MNNTIIVGLLCVCAMPALADPPTPISPPSGNGFQSVGNGLFLAVNNGGFTLQHGKTLTVAVFSREGSEINVGDHYSIDVSSINGLTTDSLVFDGGKFGELHMQLVEIDCMYRTYGVMDTRRPFDDLTWRAVTTLPALLPVFDRTCTSQSAHPG